MVGFVTPFFLQEALSVAEQLQERFLKEYAGQATPTPSRLPPSLGWSALPSLHLPPQSVPLSCPTGSEEVDSRDLQRVRTDTGFVAKYARQQGGNLDNAFNQLVSSQSLCLHTHIHVHQC